MLISRSALLLALPLSLTGVACSGEDGTASDGGTSGSTSDGSTSTTETDGEAATFVVHVRTGDCTHAPTAGVRVIMDAPDGQRVEAMTDANGDASFEGLDFAEGTASVTATKDGHDIVSYVGLTAERSPLEIPLWTPSPTVNLTGNATNMVDLGHRLLVLSSHCSRVYGGSQQSGSAYSIDLAPEQPYTLLAAEYSYKSVPSGQGVEQTIYQWYWEEREALTEDGSAEITFSGEGLSESVSGSFSLGELRDDSPVVGEHGNGYILVREGGTVYSMVSGFPTLIDINPEATAFDYTVEHVQASMLENPVTEYMLRTKEQPSAVTIRVYEPGLPRAGAYAPDFIDMPAVTPPAGDGGVYPLANETWSWEMYDAGVTPSVVVVVPSTDFYWTIYGPEDATSITIPALPEDVELLDSLRQEDAQALVALERGGDGLLAGYVDALTNTEAFTVRYE